MLIGRVIGWSLLIMAAIVVAVDLIGWYVNGSFELMATGVLWFRISPNSIELAQPAIQRHIAAWLWDPVILTVLLWPAELVLAVPGLLLAWSCRARERRGRRR
jgi:uncharacterized membrane protein (Fun14 family)